MNENEGLKEILKDISFYLEKYPNDDVLVENREMKMILEYIKISKNKEMNQKGLEAKIKRQKAMLTRLSESQEKKNKMVKNLRVGNFDVWAKYFRDHWEE